MKKALVTGCTGQDGAFLTKFLLEKDYIVCGVMRRLSVFPTGRLEEIGIYGHKNLHLVYGDLTDSGRMREIVSSFKPDEIYNLGAQSHVKISEDLKEFTAHVNYLGCLNLLEAMRDSCPQARFYQASSSEMFGSSPPPQSELTPFRPRSPYAVSKVASYHQVVNHRESYDLFAVNGILFNHESELRSEHFVTRKITRALTRIKYGLQEKLKLGNLAAKRDWGYAGDYVEAMWRIVNFERPEDFVIATGESHSVEEFLKIALDLTGVDRSHVEIDPHFFRLAEVDSLRGDPSKAYKLLGWIAQTGFYKLVRKMLEHDDDLARREAKLKN